MNIPYQLNKDFINQGYYLIDLKSKPDVFQTFLNSVPDFFIDRQGTPARADEAYTIINSLPQYIDHSEKILYGVKINNDCVGFFEILLNFPSQHVLSKESQAMKPALGNLAAKRFTITFLVIHRTDRNHGLGSKILSIIETTLSKAGYSYAHLVVNEANSNAKRFYDKHGFKVIKETIQNIHHQSQKCFIMMKALG